MIHSSSALWHLQALSFLHWMQTNLLFALHSLCNDPKSRRHLISSRETWQLGWDQMPKCQALLWLCFPDLLSALRQWIEARRLSSGGVCTWCVRTQNRGGACIVRLLSCEEAFVALSEPCKNASACPFLLQRPRLSFLSSDSIQMDALVTGPAGGGIKEVSCLSFLLLLTLFRPASSGSLCFLAYAALKACVPVAGYPDLWFAVSGED